MKTIYKISLFGIFTFSLLSYSSVFVPPDVFWPAILFSYCILPVLFLNVLLFLFLFIIRNKLIIWPILALLVGSAFILQTIRYSLKSKTTDYSDSFSVLSFNVKFFRGKDNNSRFSQELINWVINESSDIKCLQEYSTNDKREKLDISNRFIKNGYYDYIYEADMPGSDNNPGMAILSRYPIVNKGEIIFNDHSINNCIYADIKIKNDTIRIYNTHLFSMRIPLYQFKSHSNFINKIRSLVYKLRSGSIFRKNQIELLIQNTKSCSYPFIICGDFNEIPYGYNYRVLTENFSGSFEKAGKGFGFSLNSKAFFLRIDHHFYSEGLEPMYYHVDRNIKISDHFPVKCIYQVN